MGLSHQPHLHPLIGLGASSSDIHFYIANRPPMDDYPTLAELRGLAAGELAHIVKHTSNHWRKAFNVYAKLLFDWYTQQGRKDLPARWQEYRDLELFQPHSREALVFSPLPPPQVTTHTLKIIAGKTYAARLDLPPLVWLDAHFAINRDHHIIVAPYPDYRQLSNERIARLIELMQAMLSP
ncbi:DUF6942 family protein [Cellvibrio japonicus]|uniref:Uncharacterized protein n=1 Tax=Cellvibrio japonicus (strain Ueda107) TaxID=498211 RepID=B3PL29_CELJU|nr:hypothetical protein CJA_2543 [Cellvibrio japonicus Ueda107]QEI12920.1 hypothetical protein FY117_12275 [Cellvibrio japonicus]QEI16494.1 hypothetical protein FY116_12280 [Cellvibrio japonicus]QEI20072.1 hypothetical protein FY115_12275 [Cellvibrio japonicus]